jgi:hypothetical protein
MAPSVVAEASMRWIDVYRRQIDYVLVLLFLIAFWTAFGAIASAVLEAVL